MVRWLIVTIWMMMGVCSCQLGSRSAAPASARPFVELSNSSEPRRFYVELATNPKDQERGLMYRKQLPQDEGMLFVFSGEEKRTFWMRNTYVALDILFLDRSGTVVAMAPNTKPLDETLIPSGVPAQYVLEINAGLALQYDIKIGSKLIFRNISPSAPDK